MKYLYQYVSWKVIHVSEHNISQAYCEFTECWVITRLVLLTKKIKPILLVNNCYNYMKGIEITSDHEIFLGIGPLKGISCVWTWYSTGLLSLWIHRVLVAKNSCCLVALLPTISKTWWLSKVNKWNHTYTYFSSRCNERHFMCMM
jgi:hypothetical protein